VHDEILFLSEGLKDDANVGGACLQALKICSERDKREKLVEVIKSFIIVISCAAADMICVVLFMRQVAILISEM
jgi:hypothetical protein